MSRKDLRAYLSLAAILATQSAVAAAGQTLPIKKISVDGSKQLVVEFGGGSFPAVPHVLDLPGPNHRVVLDFTDAAVDKANLPGAEDLTQAVKQSLPFVKSIRYSNLENAPSPTARIVLDVPEETKFKPRVVKLEEGSIVISLGDDLPTAGAAAAPNTVASADVATPTAGETPIGEEVAAPAADQPAGLAPHTDAAPADATIPVTNSTTETTAPTPAAEATAPADSAPAPLATTEPAVETSAPAPAETTAPTPAATETAPAPSAVTNLSPMPAGDTEADKKLGAVRHYNEAVKAHLQGKLSDAITEYKSALESNSSLAEAHSNLGLIFNQQHNYAQALAEFRKALAINPKDAITYNGIGAALRAERDLQGAIKNWQTAVSLDPKLATAHYNLGTAYEINKDYDRALDSYNSAVKNDYRLGEAYYRMGLIMERKKRLDDAAHQFNEALKVSTDSEYSEDARQRLAFLQKSGHKVK